MTGEEGVRRRGEAGRRELIERLSSEEQFLSREEVEERERRAEEVAPKERHDWFFLLRSLRYPSFSVWLWASKLSKPFKTWASG